MLQTHRQDVLVGCNLRSVTSSPGIRFDGNASSNRIRGARLRRQADQERIKRLSHINFQDPSPSMEEPGSRSIAFGVFSATRFLMSRNNTESHNFQSPKPNKKAF